MPRFQLPPALTLTTAGALIAIIAAVVAGWLTIENLDTEDTSGDDIAVLAATMAISRHSSDLMATGAAASDGTMNRETVIADRAEVSRIKAALSEQRAILDGSAYQARAARIGAHLDSLVSAIDQIEAGRPDILRALLRGEQARQELTVTNTRSLFPALRTSIDNQIFFMLTGESEFRSSPASATESVSEEELLRFWHLTSLSSAATVGHATLAVASALQNPTFVGRTQEALASIGQRMERSLEYLAENGGPELDPEVLPLASQLREASVGQGNQLDALKARLELAAAEQELIAASEEIHSTLLGELDALAGEVRERASAQPGDSAGTARAGRIALLVIGIAGVAGMLAAGGYFGLRRSDAS